MGTPRSEGLATTGSPAADAATGVNRQAIVSIDALIRPYLRRTPVIEVDRADFGLPPGPLVLKLELLQHTGSFKARGAFANLLLRDIPEAGVVAASGGNHGVAVSHAASVLGVPARIYVPHSPSRPRSPGSGVTARTWSWRATHTPMPWRRARSGRSALVPSLSTPTIRPKPCSARALSAMELADQAPDGPDPGTGQRGWRRAARRGGRVVQSRPGPGGGRRAGGRANPHRGDAGRPGRWTRRPAAWRWIRWHRAGSAS